MDFLSTPMPANTGTEEIVKKRRIGWSKGLKNPFPISNETRAKLSAANRGCTKASKPKYTFEGKGAREWAEILGGDCGQIMIHIKNGTMHEYRTYCKWANIPYTKNSAIKHSFQGKTVKQWAEIIGGDAGTIRDHIINGTMHEYRTYCKWANIPCTAKNKNTKYLYKGKTVKQWAEILHGDTNAIRRNIHNGTMQQYIEKKTKGTSCNLQ